MNRLIELRQKRAELLAKMRKIPEAAQAAQRAMTDEETRSFDDMKKELAGLEKDIEVAVTLADAERGQQATETADLQETELRSRFSVTRVLTAVSNDVRLDGAEREYLDHLNIDGDNAIPLDLLCRARQDSGVEVRADAVSPQTTGGDMVASGAAGAITPAAILGRVFEGSDMDFLRVSMPTVDAGVRRYPVLVSGASAAAKTRGADTDAAAAKFSIFDAKPKRHTARYLFDLEGVMEFGDGLETGLRLDLQEAISDAVAESLINGAGSGGAAQGLIAGLTATEYPGGDADSTQMDWAKFRDLPTGALDGKYAQTERDVRMLLGAGTYSRGRAVFRAGNNSERDGINAMEDLGAMVRRSSRIPGEAQVSSSDKQLEYLLIARNDPSAIVVPMWGAARIIRDELTHADTGQVALTVHSFHDVVIRRADSLTLYLVNPNNTAS